MNYQQTHQHSINDPEQFWREQALKLAWFQQPETILRNNPEQPSGYEWFAGGKLNICYLALDYHVEQGRGEQVALYYDSPITGNKYCYTYSELLGEVAKFAGVLQQQGVGKGDRVVIYMPMIPQAAIAMLAVARLGAIHSVVFGGFAAHELAVRIDDAQPKLVISASHGIEPHRVIPYKPLLDLAITKAKHKPLGTIVYQRNNVPEAKKVACSMREGFDIDWQSAMESATPANPIAVASNDPLYILYTSGTTGKPKGVVRDTGGYATALHYSMKAIYNLEPGDVMFSASDVGWVVGHSYIVYGPLLAGCSTVLYEGKPVFTPDAGAFWRICEEYKVNAIFAAPTAFRAIRKEDPEAEFLQKYDISSVKNIFMAGERLDPATFDWACEKTGKPVIDHWWQTESGWPICASPAGIERLSVKAGSSSLPVPGYNVMVLDDSGDPIAANEQGNIAIQLPLPPGCLTTIWDDSERFQTSYLQQFPGYYASGDGGYIDSDGYVFIMGRTDDVINVAGHRLSTGEMEEVVASHPAVAECCVVGASDSLKGQQPIGLIIMKNGLDITPEQLEKELIALVREEIGALACFKKAVTVKQLPKTRSGKILRNLVRKIADGHDYVVPSTIDNPESINEIKQALKSSHL
ncbi:acyl-CoA synthetase/AMP-acid ligase [Idiomarina sp. A28L]|uniref:propionyl-CoA synthetase n=1 Tax=Idiomarina sp. A28L TaxID=1036674 RepID=UPI0002138A24|nr:propionyl-CoA synthetase [Idiomarina sp. A28L]EGN75002.1 acyl-CoA synthetase/AMP-acid ligase [Idiomarina sp. A28L]